MDETAARAAGLLVGACSMAVEATDAVVVEGSLRRRQPVVTSDRQHLEALAEGSRREIAIIDV